MRSRPGILAGVIVVTLVVGLAVGFVVARADNHSVPHGGAPINVTTSTTTANSTPQTTQPALAAPTVVPANNAIGVAPTAPIVVTFAAPLASDSPLPTLAPTTTGSWSRSGATLTFTPTVPFIPLSKVTLTVPGGSSGVRGESGALLATDVVDNFQIVDGSVLRLQQLLSLLDYSPLAFTPTGTTPAPSDTAGQIAAFYSAPAGTFSWRQTGWPALLTSFWKQGQAGVMTQGLVMEFEADHGLATDGMTSAGLWNDLLTAIGSGEVNTGGYNYALANKKAPEMLTIWHDGKVVETTADNTGATGTPTPDGNFPVYARYRNQVMRGTNPDGAHYADPVQFVAYFHAGDAVHYLNRADYGIPQSLGCIELPLASAAKVWPYLAYGTIVSVIG